MSCDLKSVAAAVAAAEGIAAAVAEEQDKDENPDPGLAAAAEKTKTVVICASTVSHEFCLLLFVSRLFRNPYGLPLCYYSMRRAKIGYCVL